MPTPTNMAIEPSYRRLWPRQLVAWARVVGGRFRDPLVGRDVLLGVLWGVIHTAILPLLAVGSAQAGSPVAPQLPAWGGNTVFVVLLVGGLAAYGFHTSLAGKSVFGDEEAGAAGSA